MDENYKLTENYKIAVKEVKLAYQSFILASDNFMEKVRILEEITNKAKQLSN